MHYSINGEFIQSNIVENFTLSDPRISKLQKKIKELEDQITNCASKDDIKKFGDVIDTYYGGTITNLSNRITDLENKINDLQKK